jgi:glycosyltransferase involved in cell wall biosynthesis
VLSVGIVIPTYNSAATVTAAIESAFAQEPAPAQIVVVDDGSTDGTADALRQYAGRIEYVRQANRGPAAARNAGLARLLTDTVVFLDADDLLLPGALECRRGLIAGADAAWVYTDGWLEDEPGVRRRFSALYPPPSGRAEGRIFADLLRRNFICVDAVMARLALVRELGDFDETIRGTEDWDLWLRLGARHPVRWSSQATFVYRLRPNTVSSDRRRMDRMRYQTLVKAQRLFPAEVRAAGVAARRSVADAHNALALAFAAEGRWREAAPYLATSLRLWPLQRRACLLFLRCRRALLTGA